MSWTRLSAALGLAIMVGTSAPAGAQSSEIPSNAPVQVGPLVLAPVIRITNLGHDSNIYNLSDVDRPIDDVTATFNPTVDAWLRLAHANANARTQVNVYYFKELEDLRGVDSESTARIEVPLGRMMPFVSGTFNTTRHRQNLEIDALARRRSSAVTAGLDVRLTAKTTLRAHVRRSALDYDANSLYLGTDLSRALNRRSTGEGLALRYALTPLTTISMEVDRDRDRFEFENGQNSRNIRFTPAVEFKPSALISGRAYAGFQKRTFDDSRLPDFTGTIVFADLTYALLGRTLFTIQGQRQLEYSYLAVVGATDYLLGGANLGVTHRFGEAWDLGAFAGRYRLTYRVERALPAGSTQPPAASSADVPGVTPVVLPTSSDERVWNYGGDVGYTFGRTRLGVRAEWTERDAEERSIRRTYERLRVNSSITYAF